mmetsp:Transcript_48887/g.98366  ORF Transcript_48887/g.98366 Transcript_48887/m.98366 type:complete len:219 (-) Transcript_48887:176-832(-)
MQSKIIMSSFSIVIMSLFCHMATSFVTRKPTISQRTTISVVMKVTSPRSGDTVPRRNLIFSSVASMLLGVAPHPASGAEPLPNDVGDLIILLKEARQQLEKVPSLVENQKWDSVRAVLITPPLSDCWSKNSRPLLKALATYIGENDGDEMAALEAREDAISHLQYLDMSVYNNNFSPVKSEGESGSTKQLVRDYYEMPLDELKSSKKALDTIVELASQ